MNIEIKHKFEVDDDIGDIIVKLNKKHIFTRFCCSGHPNNMHPYVSFTIGASRRRLKTVPENWIKKKNQEGAAIYRLFSEYELKNFSEDELLKIAMKELDCWVDSLERDYCEFGNYEINIL